MSELSHFPGSAQALRKALDSLVDEIAAQAASHEVQVGSRIAGPRRERPRQALAKLIETLHDWFEIARGSGQRRVP